mgnify:CR=1 FL=1
MKKEDAGKKMCPFAFNVPSDTSYIFCETVKCMAWVIDQTIEGMPWIIDQAGEGDDSLGHCELIHTRRKNYLE